MQLHARTQANRAYYPRDTHFPEFPSFSLYFSSKSSIRDASRARDAGRYIATKCEREIRVCTAEGIERSMTIDFIKRHVARLTTVIFYAGLIARHARARDISATRNSSFVSRATDRQIQISTSIEEDFRSYTYDFFADFYVLGRFG